MDTVLRIVVFFVAGGLLILVNAWFARTVYRTFFPSTFVIAPIQVIGQKEENPNLGGALANHLRSQLSLIARGLEIAQESLVGEAQPKDVVSEELTGFAAGRLFATGSVSVPTALLEPVNINVSVAGVEVGGLIPWLQRELTSSRALTFSVLMEGDRAIVSGDIRPLTNRVDGSLWIEVEPPATPAKIAAQIAYAVIQSKLSADEKNKVGMLALDEFKTLVTTIVTVARLNGDARRGLGVKREGFDQLFGPIERLVTKVPQWYELTLLAAEIADRTGRKDKALQLYRQVKQLADDPDTVEAEPKVRARIEQRIAALEPQAAPLVNQREQAFVEASRQYARQLGLSSPDPMIVFGVSKYPTNPAFWDGREQRYEVNSSYIDQPGLPEYIALMGRFLAKHFQRCFGNGQAGGSHSSAKPSLLAWNDFRYGVTDYILSTTRVPFPDNYTRDRMIDKALSQMEAELPDKRESMLKLALALLDRYECDWTPQNLEQKILAINEELKLIPPEIITRAFATAMARR
jgi:hypothetical protein